MSFEMYFDQMKSLVDGNGKVDRGNPDFKASIKGAQDLCREMLGGVLEWGGRKFIITMLEIYYGGLGDGAHDWYRTRFEYKNSKDLSRTAVQSKKGFCVYISSDGGRRKRFDIVVGNEGVAVSFLVRGLRTYDAEFEPIGDIDKGSPNIVLQELGLSDNDLGKPIVILPKDNVATRLIEREGLKFNPCTRKNISDGFESENGVEWNFSLGK